MIISVWKVKSVVHLHQADEKLEYFPSSAPPFTSSASKSCISARSGATSSTKAAKKAPAVLTDDLTLPRADLLPPPVFFGRQPPVLELPGGSSLVCLVCAPAAAPGGSGAPQAPRGGRLAPRIEGRLRKFRRRQRQLSSRFKSILGITIEEGEEETGRFPDVRAAEKAVLSTGGALGVLTIASPIGLVQLDPATTKAARELYIGNLPPNVEVPQLLEFLNAAMAAVGGGVLPGPPAVKAWRSSDGHYAFVEFRTMEEASNAMQLNGLSCLGFNLRIGRPKTYPMELQHIVPAPTIPLLHPAAALASAVVTQLTQPTQMPLGEVASVAVNAKAALEAAQAAARAAQGQNGVEGPSQPDRLCVLGLPASMPEEKIRQLVETFGPLKTFHVLKKDTDDSQVVCVIEYQDTDSQQQAMEILHTNSPYRVVTAEQAINEGAVSSFLKEKISLAGSSAAPPLLRPQVCTRVLVLHNIVTPQDDDDEYADIVEDIRIECEECGGRVVEVQVPRMCQDPCLDPRHIHYLDDAAQKTEDGVDAGDAAGSAVAMGVKREEQGRGPAASGSESASAKAEQTGVKTEAKDSKEGDGDEMVTEEMVLDAVQGKTKVMPPMVGYAYVAFIDCEASANARKALNGRKFSGRVVEAHYFSELLFLQRAFASPTPNFYKGHSCLHSPALAALVKNLKEEAASSGEQQHS
ncbi:u2 small nuclear ribonucleoprotein auxiliary factor [Cyclospora cayetanensis]|uniref:U2 small nuclear ribonucleoprotein auxiliary factor n=1 Tax=Cyclospora cayetanensis TaxID=88456 RepID=A0A1D3CX04_9EIME|nr:u2 small nuclear ribonucleoprotein auxiliary factor [Cyclospora cayetanensis]